MHLSGPNFTHWPISSGNSPGVQDTTTVVGLNNFLPNIYTAPLQRIKPNEPQLSQMHEKQPDIKETDVRHRLRNEPGADQFIPETFWIPSHCEKQRSEFISLRQEVMEKIRLAQNTKKPL